jgi:hypothetical protein
MSKKIISFSLWGRGKMYLCGAIANAKLAQTLFPGWICRFYAAVDTPKRIIDDLSRLGCEIVFKPVPMGYVGLFWRFEAAYDDEDIERFIVRDADSRLTSRDAGMVREWEANGEPCHIIRDDPGHCCWMPGALWGLVPSFVDDFRSLVSDFWENWCDGATEKGFESKRGKFFGVDQEFLSRQIWPLIKDNHLAHVQDYPQLKFTGREKIVAPPNRKQGDSNLVSEPYCGQVCNLESCFDNYNIEGE